MTSEANIHRCAPICERGVNVIEEGTICTSDLVNPDIALDNTMNI